MERSLVFLILILGIVWLIADDLFGKKKVLTNVVKGIMG